VEENNYIDNDLFFQGMDRGVPGERRSGHVDEQLALDGWQIVDGHHRPTAMCRVSTGRR